MKFAVLALSLLVSGTVAASIPFESAHAASKFGSFASQGKYRVSGGVTVTTSGGKTTVKLASNFKTSSGPDLYVYVGNGGPSKRIAKLRKFRGGQTYTFSGTSPISSVHIYCKRFSVGFGSARLR